jgi:hypothetical protein
VRVCADFGRRQRRRLVAHAVGMWRVYLAHQRETTTHCTRLFAHCRHRRLAKAYATLARHAQLQHTRRFLFHAVLRRYRQLLLRGLWQQWQKQTVKDRAVVKLKRNLNGNGDRNAVVGRAGKRAFGRWHRYCATMRYAEAVALATACRRHASLLVVAAALSKAATVGALKQAARAVSRWKLLTHESRTLRNLEVRSPPFDHTNHQDRWSPGHQQNVVPLLHRAPKSATSVSPDVIPQEATFFSSAARPHSAAVLRNHATPNPLVNAWRARARMHAARASPTQNHL